MKVVLFDPGYGGEGFNSYGKTYWGSRPHHGLCSISAMAKREGFNVELLDLRCLKDWDHFRSEIAKTRPDVVGLTMRTLDHDITLKAVEIVRSVCECKIVLGGIHPSLYPEEFVENDMIDFVVIGEGEISFVNLLKGLKNDQIPEEKVIYGVRPVLDDLPFEDMKLYDLGSSVKFSIFGGLLKPPNIQMVVSRGCVFNCKFCQPAERKLFGKKVRYRSVDSVLEELMEYKKRFNIRSFQFQDDHFLQNVRWVEEFIESFPRKFRDLEFAFQTRSDSIVKNEENVRVLAELGLRLIIIGFESGSQRVLNFLRKGTTVEQNINAAEVCRKYGILVSGNYMLGIPTETKEEVMETVRMAEQINADFPSIAFYTPIPGSDLYDYCIDNKLSLIRDYSDFKRDPSKPKIRGVDYDFLNKAMTEIISFRFKIRLIGMIMKKFYVYSKDHLWLRDIASKIYSRFVKLTASMGKRKSQTIRTR